MLDSNLSNSSSLVDTAGAGLTLMVTLPIEQFTNILLAPFPLVEVTLFPPHASP